MDFNNRWNKETKMIKVKQFSNKKTEDFIK